MTPHFTDVAIIGGGFSGAAVGYHLATQRPGTSITIIEPRSRIGPGLAYDDPDPEHRINVPATRMSLLPEDEQHFARWLDGHGGAERDLNITGRDGNLYPSRSVFGEYVNDQLQPLLESRRIFHVRSRAASVTKLADGFSIATEDGRVLTARLLVIATSHPPPERPAQMRVLGQDERIIDNPYPSSNLSTIAPNDDVLIIGTGLTMADVVATLHSRGHKGSITAISRRGLRSRGHSPAEVFGDFSNPPLTASSLLAYIRTTIRQAAGEGVSWHGVIDAVRAHAQLFWPQLSLTEKSRIVRHLRPFWDVHRFRIAPQLEDLLTRKSEDRSLRFLAGSIIRTTAVKDRLNITIRARRAKHTHIVTTDRIVITTGPAHASILNRQSFLASLAAAGVIVPDSLNLGIACDSTSRATDAFGTTRPNLFIAGPLARATFGELMGVPQVASQAADIADQLAAMTPVHSEIATK